MTKHTNTPELRFPGFRDEWKATKLGSILEDTNIKENHDAPLYSLTVENGITEKTERYNREFLVKKNNNFKIVKPFNIVYNPMNITLGAIDLLSMDKEIKVSGYYNVLRIINQTNPFFLINLLKTYKSILLFKKVATGSLREKQRVHFSEFKNLKKYLPSYIEQEKIGSFFSKLDRQIELEEEKLELLEQQKRGYMQKIFTQELKFKNSQLENIKWSYKTLEELNSFFTDGNYGESYPKSEDMSDKNDGVAFLRGSNLKKGRITLEDANYISKKKHSELTTGHLFLDDIVIAVRGSLGAVGYVNENMVGNNINSQLAIIRTSSSLLYGKYLLYYLMSNQGKKELLSRVTGTALKQLPIKQIKQIKVPVPKLYEQHKIANFLSELDNLIDNQTEKIELLKERKKGFLQKMFV